MSILGVAVPCIFGARGQSATGPLAFGHQESVCGCQPVCSPALGGVSPLFCAPLSLRRLRGAGRLRPPRAKSPPRGRFWSGLLAALLGWRASQASGPCSGWREVASTRLFSAGASSSGLVAGAPRVALVACMRPLASLRSLALSSRLRRLLSSSEVGGPLAIASRGGAILVHSRCCGTRAFAGAFAPASGSFLCFGRSHCTAAARLSRLAAAVAFVFSLALTSRLPRGSFLSGCLGPRIALALAARGGGTLVHSRCCGTRACLGIRFPSLCARTARRRAFRARRPLGLSGVRCPPPPRGLEGLP